MLVGMNPRETWAPEHTPCTETLGFQLQLQKCRQTNGRIDKQFKHMSTSKFKLKVPMGRCKQKYEQTSAQYKQIHR